MRDLDLLTIVAAVVLGFCLGYMAATPELCSDATPVRHYQATPDPLPPMGQP